MSLNPPQKKPITIKLGSRPMPPESPSAALVTPAPVTKEESAAQPEPAPATSKPSTAVITKPAPESVPAAAKSTSAAPAKTKPETTAIKSKAAPSDKTKTQKPESSGFSSGIIIFGIVGLAVLGCLLYFTGILPRINASTQLDQEQKLSTERRVVFVSARLAVPKSELPLPGSIQAFQQASIFARTTGYVKRWLVDIGDQVKEGDLLAELDTPEVDQQLSQAQSTAEQAKAAVEIAQTAADRWDAMAKTKAVSQEEVDEKDSTLKQAKATYDADMANVQQLTATQNFKQIHAPFAGTITFRHIEVGNLVTAGSGSGSNNASTEIFRIAQTDPLRIYVDVPEGSAPSIQPGVEADVHVQAYPDRVFKGNVVRNAGALDVTSRTLRTEIQVPNKDGALLPGAYADVRLELLDKNPAVLIPANTLIINSAGTQVAMLQDGNDSDHFKVHLMPVKIGRDFGTEVEILSNLKAGDRLVTNPATDLSDGTVVTGKALPPPTPPAPPAPPQKS